MAKRTQSTGKRESSARPGPSANAEKVEVVVKVHRPNYVPRGVTVRAQISPLIFTTRVLGADLPEIEQDPGVQSISINKTLRTIG